MAGQWEKVSNQLLNALNLKSINATTMKKKLLNLNTIKEKIKKAKDDDNKKKLKDEFKKNITSLSNDLTAFIFYCNSCSTAGNGFKNYIDNKVMKEVVAEFNKVSEKMKK